MNVTTEPPRRLKHIIFPDGIAIEPAEVLQNSDDPVESSSSSLEKEQQRKEQYCEADASATADLFVTMCFFARLGFTQPPYCLKCAYHSSGCGSSEKMKDIPAKTTISQCNRLVPWRIDANIPLHPDQLEGNVVFVTCDTARSLVNGDAYPSIRWDSKKKRLIIADRRQTI